LSQIGGHDDRASRFTAQENDMPQQSREDDLQRLETSASALDDEKPCDSPAVDSLDEKSDFSVFLSKGVSEPLRRLALRKLFHTRPFHHRDGLDDYDADYRSFEAMGEIVTAHARHQMERLSGNSRDLHQGDASRTERERLHSLSERSRGGEEGVEIGEAREDRTSLGRRTAGSQPVPPPHGRCLESGDKQPPDMGRAALAVAFRSRGHLVIIGEQNRALAVAAELMVPLRCTLIVQAGAEAVDPVLLRQFSTLEGGRMLQGTAVEVTGYLGAFEVTYRDSAGAGHLEKQRAERCDLLLDLTTPPRLRHELLPPGYYAPGEDPQALERAVEELPDLVGEFEKPRFLHLVSSRCAHGNARVTGCRKCIEACPAGAIRSGKGAVEIDHHLCHGCLICATACPTAAITESSTATWERVQSVAADLRHHRTDHAASPCVLFHDRDMDAAELAFLRSAPLPVVNVPLDEIGSIGMDVWFALLAQGASHVILWGKDETPASVLRELELQSSYATTILAGMGYDSQRLQFIAGDEGMGYLNHLLETLKPEPEIPPTLFPDLPGKPAVIRRAVQHLYQQADSPHPMVAMPDGAPFGAVEVDPHRCTLCMACAGVCPVSAISGSDTGRQLRFFEWECVQCGLCRQACPEQAIRLVPRMRYQVQPHGLLLHQEEPFYCVCCGEPFATRKMVHRLGEKLAGHWMFQDDAARRRLEMCTRCRLQDMFDRQETIRVHR
jgi:ferredoxin